MTGMATRTHCLRPVRVRLAAVAIGLFTLGFALPEAKSQEAIERLPPTVAVDNRMTLTDDREATESGLDGHFAGQAIRATGWAWDILPDGLIYRSYLAGGKEPRIAGQWVFERDQGWLWDVTLGARVGILRWGTCGPCKPDGWQLDIEGAAFPRLELEDDLDLISSDFRFGIPLTFGMGPWATKVAYYHLSSHLGDELIENTPGIVRINYSRDVMVLGGSYYLWDWLRFYGEAGYGIRADEGSDPWEIQFGCDAAPAWPTGWRGAPFAAVNGHLREEVDFGGTFAVQAGWAWRGAGAGRLLRAGGVYTNGKSLQFEFVDEHEEQIGVALWYDF